MHRLLAALAALPVLAAVPPSLRLGNSVNPVHYAVELTVTPGQPTFSGRVDMDIDIAEPQEVIWLNAVGLSVSKASIGSQPATVVPGNEQVVGFTTGASLKPGRTTLRVTYTGRVSKNSSAGIFQLDEDNRWYVYSQFEPTDARRAFPCFDEPGIKTPWDISLRVPRQMMALANSPQTSEADGGSGMKLVKFATTRPLPSYLVAIGVGPFEAVDLGKAGRKSTPLRIIVPYGKKAEAQYAAQAIPQLLTRLEDYFGIPYPYAKLDSLVMPISNFAMENVGLITYGESLLLSKPERDTINRRRGCAVVAAHEMAHQWFGDLVTTSWWDDIWLNEAFATWMESKIVSQWKPDWRLDAEDVDDRLGAMRIDSLVSARRIRQPIAGDDDIANAFDGITYQKGAAVIRMFENSVGSEVFRRGVQQYLKDNSDRGATSAQFLAAISKAAGRDVGPAFSTFLDQAGVPVLSVDLKCDEGRQPAVALTQKRYLPTGSPGGDARTWQIPVCIRYDVDGKTVSQCDMLSDPRSTMTLKEARACPAWIMANAGGNGYYRAVYSPQVLDKLSNASQLTLPEKLTLLGDLGPLVASGDTPVSGALLQAQRSATAPQRDIVEAAIGIAALAQPAYLEPDVLPNSRLYILSVFGQRALELGWVPSKGETEDNRLLRQELVPFVARGARVATLLEGARRLARAWLKDHAAVDPGMTQPVLSVAAIDNDGSYFDALVKALDNEKDSRTRRAILSALGSFNNPELANAGMELLLAGKYDARESFGPLLFGPLAYRETRGLPFEFVQNNLDALLSKLPREVGGDFAGDLPEVGRGFCDATSRNEVEAFFKDKVQTYTGGPRRLAGVLESIDICIAQHDRIAPNLIAFLRTFKM